MIQHAPPDSVVVASPLPGGVAAIVRFFFQVPQWIQIGGAVLGAAVAVLLAALVWRRRRALWAWVTTRRRGVKLGMAAGAAVLLVGAVGAGTVSWDYMQHDNGFCTGCHVMGPAFERFTASEHDSLSCHDCHQQPLSASARQLYLWVLERPEEIGEHAPVPNARCEACHVTDQPEVWQRIATTAGHRTHLESDSSDLRDVQCVTCHGLEVHSFVPVDSTCAQADCHVNASIALGPMANQTSLHCATCHEFAVEVPLLATRDSAAGTLTPADDQCFSCHAMREVLAEFDAALDPHGGTCGMCHDPHAQATASEAAATCASAGCHDGWRAEPFHTGANHRRIAESCLTCHAPHRAAVDASDCATCHRGVAEREDVPRAVRDRLRRALPFDTAAAARVGMGWGLGIPTRQEIRGAPPDSFPHARHADLTCITCHTTRDGTAGLVFQRPRGCQLCHHQGGTEAPCASCHVSGGPDAASPVTVTVHVAARGPASNAAAFDHQAHGEVPCASCHTSGAALEVTSRVAACRDCHDDHHAARRQCAACHVAATASGAHGPPADAHVGCDACHAVTTVRALVPDRPFCASCHGAQAGDHYAARECTTCHMLSTPEAWRRHLTTSRAR